MSVGTGIALLAIQGAGVVTIGDQTRYPLGIGYGTNWFRPIAFDPKNAGMIGADPFGAWPSTAMGL